MRNRLNCLTLLCVLSLGTETLDCQAADAAGRRFHGVVTQCQATATVQRGRRHFALRRGAGILVGDRIETGDGALISVAMESGPVVTIGELTSLKISRSRTHWMLALDAGEVRIVNDGTVRLAVETGHGSLVVGKGIVHVDRLDPQVRVESVSGEAICSAGNGEAWRIPQGESYVIESDSRPRKMVGIDWTMEVDAVRLAAAMQTSPQLVPPSLPPTSSSDISPESSALDQSGVASATQGPEPIVTPADEFFPDDIPLDDIPPTEEAEPLVAQQPPPATRGVEDDRSDIDGAFAANLTSFSGNSSLSLGSLSSASGSFFAGGLFGDANQQTFEGMVVNGDGTPPDGSPFPGAIHLVTAERRLPFSDVQLSAIEFASIFGSLDSKYFSIGTGPKPTGQVLTNFFTGTGAVPTVVEVPRFGDHLIFLDQYGITDPVNNGLNSNVGLTGLIGPTPTGPVVVGAAPLEDARANFNSGATFALGEFLVAKDGANGISFAIRRSDQDRLIVKDPGGNDALDQVTPNPDSEFVDTTDPRFLPQSPTVKVPDPTNSNSLNPRGTMFGDLDFRRRAAFTTLVADQLKDYAQRTGQTRFVVDGKIVDISGYQPGH